MKALLPLLFGIVLTGCTSFGPAAQPLELLEEYAFEFSGSVAPRGEDLTSQIAPPLSRAEKLSLLCDDHDTLGPQVSVAARFVRIDADCARRRLGGTGASPCVARVDSDRATAFLDELVDAGEATVVLDPATTATPGSVSVVSTLAETHFIQSFDLEGGGSWLLADPCVGKAEEGMVLRFRPELIGDGRTFAVDLHVLQAELVRPFPTVNAPFTSDLPALSLEVPVTLKRELKARPEIDGSATLLLTGFGAGDPDEVVVAFLHVTLENPRAAENPLAAGR